MYGHLLDLDLSEYSKKYIIQPGTTFISWLSRYVKLKLHTRETSQWALLTVLAIQSIYKQPG